MNQKSNHMEPLCRHLPLTLPIAFGLLFASMGAEALAAGARSIIVCTDHHGHKTFTEPGLAQRCIDTSGDNQSGNNPASIAIQTLQPDAPPALRLTPLTDAEQRQLHRLQQRQQKSQRLQTQKRNYARQRQQRVREDNAAVCIRYQQQLDNLVTRRRRGYSLADSANLDAKLASLKRDYRQTCR